MAGSQDFTAVASDTLEFQISYVDSNDTAINLTGYTAKMQVKQSYDGPVLATASLTIATPATGVITGVLDTSPLPAGQYVYDLEIKRTSPSLRRLTIMRGVIDIEPEVTTDA